jgi:hypothetical protein
MNKKKIIIFFFATFLLVLIYILTSNKEKFFYQNTANYISKHTPKKIDSILKILFSNEINTKKINNDYNEEFLPNTQFVKVEFVKIPNRLNERTNEVGHLEIYNNKKSFYLEQNKNNVFILTASGNIYFKSIDDILNKELSFKKIKTNLSISKARDFLIDNNNIYISYVKKKSENCNVYVIEKAIINYTNLNFKKIFESTECGQVIESGKIQKIKKNNNNYILLSTADDEVIQRNDKLKISKSQNENSIYGKIIIIDEKNGNYEIFSKGHRNILGLLVDNNKIISTENGPKGGDEINKISKNKNYGWDIASYGNKSNKSAKLHLDYADHEDFLFQEPIFSFIPSMHDPFVIICWLQ